MRRERVAVLGRARAQIGDVLTFYLQPELHANEEFWQAQEPILSKAMGDGRRAYAEPIADSDAELIDRRRGESAGERPGGSVMGAGRRCRLRFACVGVACSRAGMA